MGNKSSSENLPKADEVEGGSTLVRAIARGRVYVAIRYPRSVETLSGTLFNHDQFRSILTELQQILPDFEITLDAGKTDHFCEHVSFYNSNDPNREVTRPRVLAEVLYTGAYGGINKEKIKKLLQEKLDPNGECYVDLRCEMGRYNTTLHLETVLRL